MQLSQARLAGPDGDHSAKLPHGSNSHVLVTKEDRLEQRELLQADLQDGGRDAGIALGALAAAAATAGCAGGRLLGANERGHAELQDLLPRI